MLMESIQRFKHSAQEAVENTEKMFHELIRSIEEKCSEVIEQIRAQEKTGVGHAEEHLKQVKQEIDNLKRKDHDLKQLTLIQDDILYLQVFQSLHGSSLPDCLPLANINTTYSCEDVNMFVCKLKEEIDNTVICPYSTSPCSIVAQKPEQICTPNDNSVSDSRQDIINNPFGNSSKPATECQPTFNFGFQSKPEPYFQPAPEFQTTFNFKGFSNTPTKFQFNFDSKSKAGTQAQIDPGHILKPATFGFGTPSKPATESQSIFGMSSKPDTKPKFSFGTPFKTTTESPSFLGMSSKPATESQFSFGTPFNTNTESPPVFGMSSKPATEFQFSFEMPFKTNTESPPVFGMSSKPDTEPKFSFGTPFKTITESPPAFGMSSKPDTEPK
ncbi:uncharacterized protein ftr63 [Trichomycterus rosablanca]|uniref:uncharacterized protein ftr63 n=1 Tax=Trichomycterus rosablanca TaxID=2290929 RepID=UPI002F35E530